MEQKNKNRTHNIENVLNRSVKLNRNVHLQIKYYNGLKIENDLLVDKTLQEKSVEIEKEYMEDIAPYELVINSSSKYNEVHNKELKKYEDKLYWQRRKYKTKLKRSNVDNLEELLNEYDKLASSEKEIFLKELDKKYPKTPYSKEEVNRAKDQIERLNAVKKTRLLNLDREMEKLKANIIRRNEAISLKLQNYDNLVNALDTKIKSSNESLAQIENEEILLVNEELKKPNLTEKEKDRLIDKADYLNSKIEMAKNEDIQLTVKNLKMYFGGIKAVNNVSFNIKKNQIFGLIGPNGAGKTTVFNCVTQFYKATGGAILYRNKENNIVNLNKLKTHDIIHEGVARSFQNVELIWELSVLDNLLVAAHSLLLTNYFDHMFHTVKAKKEEEILKTKAFKILSDLNIYEYAYRYPYGLPYGVLKKIELARTLMTDPSMIILDEPAAGLNEVETKELAGIIKKINQDYKTTIFLVEHDMSLVMSICDEILAISFGRELAIGTPKEIQNNENVRVAYLGEDD